MLFIGLLRKLGPPHGTETEKQKDNGNKWTIE